MRRPRSIVAVLALLVGAWVQPALATAAPPRAGLSAEFVPNQLGRPTTVTLTFDISGAGRRLPPPLTEVDLMYPANLGIFTSELGLAECPAATLQQAGPEGCPANSLMGWGSATAEVPGAEILVEHARLSIWAGPEQDGHNELLIYAEAKPVEPETIFPMVLFEAANPFGGNLHTTIDPNIVNPEFPASLTRLRLSIGPLHVLYHRRLHGRTVAYHPRGILLPRRCPRHGFRFGATFVFLDHSHAVAHASVPCPT
jgi:hypothetical protein